MFNAGDDADIQPVKHELNAFLGQTGLFLQTIHVFCSFKNEANYVQTLQFIFDNAHLQGAWHVCAIVAFTYILCKKNVNNIIE